MVNIWSVDLFLVTAILVSAPSLWFNFRKTQDAPSYRKLINILVLLHTLFMLYKLILSYPSNIFSLLKAPLNTPTESMRAVLLGHRAKQAHAPDGSYSPEIRVGLPESLETLLKSLSSWETRTFYVRFGHKVITDCTYCKTFEEFALYAFPRPLLAYIHTIALIGIVTVRGTRRERYRVAALIVLVCAFVGEAYFVATAAIRVPKLDDPATTMWHDTLWTLRHLLFLILPPALNNILPPAAPRPAQELSYTAFMQTSHALESTLGRLSLLKHTSNAIQRVPELREKSAAWYEQRRLLGELVREDELVARAAEIAGVGYGEGEEGGPVDPKQDPLDPDILESAGKLRKAAILSVHALKQGLNPSNWQKN